MQYGRGRILRTILRNLCKNDAFFKSVLLLIMCLNLAAYNILTAASRLHSPNEEQYYPTTVVFLAEVVKLLLTLFIILWNGRCNLLSTYKLFRMEIVNKPREVFEMAVPAGIYAFQNNLVYFALANIEPTMYQVLTHLKIFTTAFFMRILLGYKLIPIQWVSLLTLFFGVIIVEFDPTGINASRGDGYYQALGAIVVISFCAGFAGVNFEKQLKSSNTSFWIRNVEMYFWGIVTSSVGMIFHDGGNILNNGFFFGYTSYVWIIIVLQSVGGLFVSLVMKYLDNIFKTFATSAGILLTAAGSAIIFKTSLGLPFIFGSVLVCFSVYLFSKPPWHKQFLGGSASVLKV